MTQTFWIDLFFMVKFFCYFILYPKQSSKAVLIELSECRVSTNAHVKTNQTPATQCHAYLALQSDPNIHQSP